MKHLKMIGLAVIAAAALTALFGAASAQAVSTTLCKEKPTPTKKEEEEKKVVCPAGQQYPVGQVLKGATKGTTATLTGPKAIGNVTCESSVSGKSTGSAATVAGALPGEIETLTWSNCVLNRGEAGEVACTVTSVNLPYKSEVLANEPGNGNGTLTATAKTAGKNPGAEVKCPGVIECTYTTAKAVLAATGGAAGTANAVATKVELTGTGGKCPVSTWDGTYVLSEPTPVFIEN